MSLAMDATEVSFTKVMNTCVALPPTDVCAWPPHGACIKLVLIGSYGMILLRKRAAPSQTVYSARVFVFRAYWLVGWLSGWLYGWLAGHFEVILRNAQPAKQRANQAASQP